MEQSVVGIHGMAAPQVKDNDDNRILESVAMDVCHPRHMKRVGEGVTGSRHTAARRPSRRCRNAYYEGVGSNQLELPSGGHSPASDPVS